MVCNLPSVKIISSVVVVVCDCMAFHQNYDLPFVKVIPLLVCVTYLYVKFTCVGGNDDVWSTFCQNHFVSVGGVRLAFGQKHFLVVTGGVEIIFCQNPFVGGDV